MRRRQRFVVIADDGRWIEQWGCLLWFGREEEEKVSEACGVFICVGAHTTSHRWVKEGCRQPRDQTLDRVDRASSHPRLHFRLPGLVQGRADYGSCFGIVGRWM